MPVGRISFQLQPYRNYVRGTVARARWGVGTTRGITVIAAPGAAAAAVMPGVRSTPGLPRGGDARGAARDPSSILVRYQLNCTSTSDARVRQWPRCTQCRTGDSGPTQAPEAECPVSPQRLGLSPQSQVSPGLRPGTQSPVSTVTPALSLSVSGLSAGPPQNQLVVS